MKGDEERNRGRLGQMTPDTPENENGKRDPGTSYNVGHRQVKRRRMEPGQPLSLDKYRAAGESSPAPNLLFNGE